MRRLLLAALAAALILAAPAFARAGGGCFTGETPVLMADGSSKPIAEVKAGDSILSGQGDGSTKPSRVVSVYSLAAGTVLVLRAGGVEVRATPEHPFADGSGAFRRLDSFKAGQEILVLRGGAIAKLAIDSIREEAGIKTVYNLSVEAPNSFFASGILVHNKGGSSGGFGGGLGGGLGSRSSGGSWGGSSGGSGGFFLFYILLQNPILIVIIIALLILKAAFGALKNRQRGQKRGPGKSGAGEAYTSTDEVILKKDRAEKFQENALAVAAMAAVNDPAFEAELLKRVADDVFFKTQRAWMQRNTEALRPFFAPGLLQRHGALIQAMINAREMNVLENLTVDGVWIINVRNLPQERTFSALIQAKAIDYYVNDSTRSYIRGDSNPISFQEIWTFERTAEGGVEGWRLKQITQSDEAAEVLRRENATEDESQIKIKATSRTVAEGDAKKGERIEELSNLDELLFGLAKSDPMWKVDGLRDRASELFTKVYMARQKGDRYELAPEDLSPEILRVLIAEFDGRAREGIEVEYANFCVRSTDIVLVRNYVDNSRDEFMARITAHARIIVKRNGQVESDQGEAVRFVEHWCFTRGPKAWMVSEIDATPRREDESFDEEDVPW